MRPMALRRLQLYMYHSSFPSAFTDLPVLSFTDLLLANTAVAEFQIYKAERSTWISVSPPQPLPIRFQHSAVFINDAMYAFFPSPYPL